MNNFNLNSICNSTCVFTCSCVCQCLCNNGGNDTPNAPYGNLNIEHAGAFIAKFKISWDESTIVGNTFITTKKYWENNGVYYSAPYRTTIAIPMTATNISIEAEGNTGLIWQLWHVILNQTGLSMVPNRTIKIWGTSLNQHGSIEPESFDYGSLILEHYGNYMARFYITWEEPTVIGNSVYNVIKQWEHNGESYNSPYFSVISLPHTSSNISIKAQYYDGQTTWETLIEKSNLYLVALRTLLLWGTIAEPHAAIDPL